jgi:hypothetical protein
MAMMMKTADKFLTLTHGRDILKLDGIIFIYLFIYLFTFIFDSIGLCWGLTANHGGDILQFDVIICISLFIYLCLLL